MKKILIIDDEPDVIEYLTTLLQINGYESFSIENVKNAFAQIKKITPDLICLDIMMPYETGISFYTRLKCDEEFSQIPVIIISGAIDLGSFNIQSYISDESIPEPECFLEKPIDVNDFLIKVNQLLN